MNHGQLAWLRQCLRSIEMAPYTLGECEVIVLDNASAEQEVAELRDSFPWVRLLPQKRRRGFGENQNLSIRSATGDLVLILNPDTEIPPGTLDKLVLALTHQKGAALAAGPILEPSGEPWASRPLPFPTPAAAWARALGLDRLAGRFRHSRGPGEGWVSGCAVLVDRRVFMALGGFDEGFFMFSEDTDLAFRVHQRRHRIAWVPDAPIMHVGATSVEEASDVRTVEYVRAQIRFMQKHHGRIGSVIFRLGAAVGAFARLAFLAVPPVASRLVPKGPTRSSTRAYHRVYLRTLVRPDSSLGLREEAEEWNHRHIPDHVA